VGQAVTREMDFRVAQPLDFEIVKPGQGGGAICDRSAGSCGIKFIRLVFLLKVEVLFRSRFPLRISSRVFIDRDLYPI
jgi:hypothetical protein